MSSQTGSPAGLPRKVYVKEVVSSRYGEAAAGFRPFDWNERQAGLDVVKLEDNSLLRLYSSGQQSTPAPGWVLMLTEGSNSDGFAWTLYGIPRHS